MEAHNTPTELPTHSATCESDGACASCSSCATGLCPGTILVAAIALVWIGVVLGAKLFGKKMPANDA